MANISIGIGQDGSTISDSNIDIHDINAEGQPRERILQRIEIIENQLAGKHGTKGIHAQLEAIAGTLGEASRVIQSLQLRDDYNEKELAQLRTLIQSQNQTITGLSSLLQRYEPMLRNMEASYTTKATIPVYVFYGVMILLIFFVIGSAILLFVTRS